MFVHLKGNYFERNSSQCPVLEIPNPVLKFSNHTSYTKNLMCRDRDAVVNLCALCADWNYYSNKPLLVFVFETVEINFENMDFDIVLPLKVVQLLFKVLLPLGQRFITSF